jgi:hypothetical protein
MNKEIRVKFEDDLFIDLIGVVTITDGIRDKLKDLIEITRKYKSGDGCIIRMYLSIFNKARLILDPEVDRSELTRDHSDYIPDVMSSCAFNLNEGEDTGYFCFRVYDCVDGESEYEVMEMDSETVSLKDILE